VVTRPENIIIILIIVALFDSTLAKMLTLQIRGQSPA
jgi:hypothetical protein